MGARTLVIKYVHMYNDLKEKSFTQGYLKKSLRLKVKYHQFNL